MLSKSLDYEQYKKIKDISNNQDKIIFILGEIIKIMNAENEVNFAQMKKRYQEQIYELLDFNCVLFLCDLDVPASGRDSYYSYSYFNIPMTKASIRFTFYESCILSDMHIRISKEDKSLKENDVKDLINLIEYLSR